MTKNNEKTQNSGTTKFRTVCYLSKAGRAKADALKDEFNMSYGELFGQFLTHYGASFKDKQNKQL